MENKIEEEKIFIVQKQNDNAEIKAQKSGSIEQKRQIENKLNLNNDQLVNFQSHGFLPPSFQSKKDEQILQNQKKYQTSKYFYQRQKVRQLDGLYLSKQQIQLENNTKILLIKDVLENSNKDDQNQNYIDENQDIIIEKNDFERNNNRVYYDQFVNHEFFSSKTLHIKEVECPQIMILRVQFEKIKLLKWIKFLPIQQIFSDLEQKVENFQELLIKSRLKFLEDTAQHKKKDDKRDQLQKSADEISVIWKKIKKMKSQTISSEQAQQNLNLQTFAKQDKQSKNILVQQKLKNYFLKFKKLVVKKFINEDKQEDFYIQVEKNLSEQREEILKIIKKLNIIIRVSVDDSYVSKSQVLRIFDEEDINFNVEIFLKKRAKCLKIDLLENDIFNNLISSRKIPIAIEKNYASQFSVIEQHDFLFERKKIIKRKIQRQEQNMIVDNKENQDQNETVQRTISELQNDILEQKIQNDDTQIVQKKEITEIKGKVFFNIQYEFLQQNIHLQNTHFYKNVYKTQQDINDPRQIIKVQEKQRKPSIEMDLQQSVISKKNLRIKLLQLQKNLGKSFVVPLKEEDIQANWSYYQKLIAKTEREKIEYTQKLQNCQSSSTKQLQQQIYTKQMQENEIRVFEKIKTFEQNQKISNQNSQISVSDYITEFGNISKKNIIKDFFKDLFTQKRKLKPVIKKQKTRYLFDCDNFDLIINVLKGNYIPQRTTNKNSKLSISQTLKIPQIEVDQKETNTFVSIKFENIKQNIEEKVTEASEGTNPNWYSIFQEKIEVPKTDNKQQLQKALGNLKVRIFDYLPQLEQFENTHQITYYLEKKFLGVLNLNIFDILRKGKLHTCFRIQKPIFIFGYSNKSEDEVLNYQQYIQDQDQNSQTMNNFVNKNTFNQNDKTQKQNIENQEKIFQDILNPFTPIYIDLRITTNPLISWIQDEKQNIQKQKVMSNFKNGYEDTVIAEKLMEWLIYLKKKNVVQYKRVKAYADSTDHQSIMITRFLNVNASEKLFGKEFDIINEECYKKLAYFVQLIPDDYQRENEELILNLQEILDYRKCTNEEKAFLLSNLFQAIDNQIKKTKKVQNFVVYGQDQFGRQRCCTGRSVQGKCEIWNVDTGEVIAFRYNDQQQNYTSKNISTFNKIEILNKFEYEIPLKTINQIVTYDDIKVCKNKQNDFLQIDWNFQNKQNWESFQNFIKNSKNKIQDKFKSDFFNQSYQPNELQYIQIQNNKIQQIQKELETYIMKTIESQRLNCKNINLTKNFARPFQTKWNFQISQQIQKQLLYLLESFKYRVREAWIDNNFNENFTYQSLIDLQQFKSKIIRCIGKNKQIFGVPLNFKTLDFEKIKQQILDTEIDQVYTDEAEFLLSVRIFPYPNLFYSIWIFIGYIYQ